MVQDSSNCCQEFSGTSQHPSPGGGGEASPGWCRKQGRRRRWGAPPLSSRDNVDPASSPPAGAGPEEPARDHTARVGEPGQGASLPGPRMASSDRSAGGRARRVSVPAPEPRVATVHLECDVWKFITGTHVTKELHLIFKSHLWLVATHMSARLGALHHWRSKSPPTRDRAGLEREGVGG